MANKEKKEKKTAKTETKKVEQPVLGTQTKEPRNWPKVLRRVPRNRNVRISDLPPRPVFKNEIEKKHFLEMLEEATKNKDWTKDIAQSIKDDVLQIDFTGCGEGRVTEIRPDGSSDILTPRESQRVAEVTNRDVQNVNKAFTVPGQVDTEPKFILPAPAKESSTKVDENDIPEYVLSAFLHPSQGFMLESTIDVGNSVRVVYHRDPEYFEAVIRIGELRRMGDGYMEVSSLVTKDGASYSVIGRFSMKPGYEGAVTMTPDKQPRATRLYKYLSEKLGLN